MKPQKFLMLLALFIIITTFLIRLLTDEDVWICDHGQWVKHGVPSAPMPTSVCPIP